MAEFQCVYRITVVDADDENEAYRDARAAAMDSEQSDWEIDKIEEGE